MDKQKQKNILESYNNEQLFEQLKKDFQCIKEKIFCKVRTKENIESLIYITLDILRSRDIDLHQLKNNSWVKLDHFNYSFNERLVKLYSKVDNEMVFDKIGIY